MSDFGSNASSVGDIGLGLVNGRRCDTDNLVSNCSQDSTCVARGSLWQSSVGRSSADEGMPIVGGSDMWENETEDLAELFGRLGLGKYTDLFQQQEVCWGCSTACCSIIGFIG